MGRTAAPAALRLVAGRAEGRDSGGREVPQPPAFRRMAPNPPSTMSREAKAEWRRIVPGLARLELLKPEDRAMLTVYCETWATWVAAKAEVRRTGMTITTETTVKANPAIAVAAEAAKQLRGLAQEFGLTPSAESKLGGLGRPDDSGDDDPFD